MVVDCSSAYNAIFGRPLLVEFGAVTSIRHLYMKLPTDSGIDTVRGDQKDARQFYQVFTRSPVMMVDSSTRLSEATQDPEELDPRVWDERNIEPVEEGEEVAVDTSKPERKMKIAADTSKPYPSKLGG